MGRGAVHDHHRWVVDSVAGLACRWGGHGEGLRRSHDDAAGAKLDAKLIDRFSVNTGTIPCRSRCPGASRAFGIGTSSVDGAGWGGGLVVVRARERRAHGEGGQQVKARRPPVNTGDLEFLGLYSAERRVLEIQAKLHRWAG